MTVVNLPWGQVTVEELRPSFLAEGYARTKNVRV